MAAELRGVSASGTLYAHLMNAAGQRWDGSAFEAYDASSYADYDIAMTEQGNSGVYVADFPAAILTGGTYEYFVYRQAGGSPAEGDVVVNTGRIDWTGTAAITAAAGALSGSDFRDYIVEDKGFTRTDKDQAIYAAITDAIQVMRRKFSFSEAQTEAESTDQIATLGDFKLSIESDLGLLTGIVLEDGTTATPLEKISKARFDELYPDANVTADRGYPAHYCVYADQVYIGPVPDSIAYNYRQSYSKRAGTVTSSTAGVPFSNLYRDVLADKVLELLYTALEEYDKARIHRELFEDGFRDAKSRERRNGGETGFIMEAVDC